MRLIPKISEGGEMFLLRGATRGVKGKMLFMVNLLISYKETLRRGLPHRESKLNLRKKELTGEAF